MTVAVAQTENLLGALALAVTDRMEDAITAAAGQGPSGATALAALSQFLDDPTVDTLASVLGLTSSGTVRLVDRLVDAGAVRRNGGLDGRVTTIALTPAGRRVADRVTTARRALLEDALQVLDDAEQDELGELLGRVLAAMIRPPGAVRWTCRLCDMGACGWEEGRCPVRGAAEARYPSGG